MAKRRSLQLASLGDLITSSSCRFFEWKRPKCVLFLLEKAAELPESTVLELVGSDYDIPLVRIYYLAPGGDLDNHVGYAIRTPPRTEATVTSAYLHVGVASSGDYEPHSGMDGIQVYMGDADTILVSADVGDGYIEKVRADVIV